MAAEAVTIQKIRQWSELTLFKSWFNALAVQVAVEVLEETGSPDYIGTIDNERKRKIAQLLRRWRQFTISNEAELKSLIMQVLYKLIGGNIDLEQLDTTAYMNAGKNQIKLLVPSLAGVLPGDASIPVDNSNEQTLDYASGAGVPAIAPAFIGQYYLDTVAGSWYRSVSLSGWKLASAGAVITI